MNDPTASDTEGREAFLGVEKSLGGRRWVSRQADDRTSLAMAQALGVPEVVGRVLAGRGVGLDDAEGFLNPTLREQLPDPLHLKDMKKGADRIAAAVMKGELVAIFGDYDVDGATSSALLTRFFKAVGGKSMVYIPDRMKEGYGPNAAALLSLAKQGASLAITVDCGVTAYEPLAAAADAGLEVIVADHHVAEPALPRAFAVINPNRLDDDSPHGHLAAVGVVFLLVVQVNRALRDAGWYASRPEPDLMQWLDLVALGTVCDVVPLKGINRALVAQGVKVMARRDNPGITALGDEAGVDEPPGAYHLGFILGPRVNAGGRVGESDLGTRLLSTDNAGEAKDLARRLDALNRERQSIEQVALDQAIAQIEAAESPPTALVLACGEGWHPGVIGIVASRLKDRYNLPSCVVSLGDDEGVGSARSVSGIDLGATVLAARQAGILSKGGGHAMAAGFTVGRDRLEDLRAFMEERFAARIAEARIEPIMTLDGAVSVSGATRDLVEDLERLQPFGAGNPEPRFVVRDARILRADIVGQTQEHIRCTLTGPGNEGRLNAIAFRVVDSDIGRALLDSGGLPLHVAGRLRINRWQGRITPQLMIDDAAPVR
ncbi:MAG: single-stranded-DNA-specific exonuclease RecJ [Rhodospirillales bacterium]|nr:single-stranded-DNA-specific exonuclease RecJ [Rhodospirillales bacterium]